MKGPKTIYICSECSYKSAKWLGKCPGCGSWNTMEETVEAAAAAPTASPRRRVGLLAADERGAERLSELTVPDFMRTATGMGELDRVLGGGIVQRLGRAADRRAGYRQVDAAASDIRHTLPQQTSAVYLG